MFKNPIKKYQSGGVTPEQARQQVVQFIMQKTGAPEERVNGVLDQIAGDEKALAQFEQILQLASQDDPKGIDMLKQLFGAQPAQSQFVKKGGKLHDFICKHANGGMVKGCGCKEDGGKVAKAEMGLPRISDHSPRAARIEVPMIPGILAELRQRKVADSGNAIDRNFSKANWNGSQYFLERANVGGNVADTWIQVTPDLDTLVQQQLPSGRFTPLTQEQAQSIVDRNRADINKKEDGGVIKGEKGLSRKDALAAARNNYGFDKGQARLAYANAKNALRNSGLRGSALKQAAREMIANRPAGKEGVQAIPSTEPIALSVTPETVKAPVTTSAPKQFDLSNMPYNEAFGLAVSLADRGLGTSTFNYKGITSGTKRANTRKRDKDKEQKKQEKNAEIELPIIDTNFEIETPEVEIPQFEQLPTEFIVLPTASKKYPINVQQYTLDPSFWGSDLMSENSVNASAARNGLFTARVKANPVDIDNPDAVRLATYTKVPVDSSIEGAPVSLHYVSAEPRAVRSSVYSPIYKAPRIVTRETGGVVKGQQKPNWINKTKNK